MNITKLYKYKVNDRRSEIQHVEIDRRKNDRRFFFRLEVLSGINADIQFIKKFLRLLK